MSRIKNRKGFTMAEMLITVAILVVLAALAFVGVTQYMKSMHQLEMDAIAKQIFISAQNHLSMADSQGFPGMDKDDTYGQVPNGKPGVYYIIYANGTITPETAQKAFDLILPFGAVDETVRAGGTYIIRYQKSPAVVLDVFYAATSGRYSYSGFTGDDYAILFEDYTGDKNKEIRRDYNDGAVIGWYGGDDILSGEELIAPSITVVNGDVLKVIITDPNVGSDKDYKLQLLIKGLSSGKTGVIESTSFKSGDSAEKFVAVLDDICSSKSVNDKHFAELFSEFYPGENISVQAKVFSDAVLTNVATSELKITNSLFDDATTVTAGSGGSAFSANAAVSNIRHLENLSEAISNCGNSALTVGSAVQIADLDWQAFKNSTDFQGDEHDPFSIKLYNKEDVYPDFLAVNTKIAISYDGGYHSITGIEENESGNAGLFGTLLNGSAVRNLELIAFKIRGENAGALAGIAAGTTVTNVLVRGLLKGTTYTETEIIPTKSDGSAGGLIGSFTGSGNGDYSKPDVNKCASTAKVTSSVTSSASYLFGNAGGLIGSAKDAVIVSSYSAGHVNKDASNMQFEYDPAAYDVNASGSAGGLIGVASGTTKIQYSYSTCSVSGNVEGGFIGEGSNAEIQNCYSTGLIDRSGTPSNLGAFAGTYSGTASSCWYYEIINEISDETSFTYLKAVNSSDYTDGDGKLLISALDADLQSYQNFVKNPSDWKPAKPANSDLDSFYNHRYSLETVQQLGGDTSVLVTDYVFTHYGDWPAPETLVINVK